MNPGHHVCLLAAQVGYDAALHVDLVLGNVHPPIAEQREAPGIP